MAALYLGSQIGGALFSLNFRPEVRGIGCSCACFGLIGFYLAYLFTHWDYMGRCCANQRYFLAFICCFFALLN